MGNLSDMKQPEFNTINLLNGKKAVVGPITLEVLCWVEEKYGDWESFQENALRKKKLAPMASFIFQMLQNKSDFTDESEFFRSFSIQNINDIFEVLNKTVSTSMVKAEEVATTPVQNGDDTIKKP
jgi:uncharacterized protein YjfI (DUF2170 family)